MDNEKQAGKQISKKINFALQATETRLVEDVQSCRSEKWDELWKPYKSRRVSSWIRQLISENDVRDIVLFIEDCVHALHSKMFFALKNGRPKNPKAFGGYVYVGVRNYIRSWHRDGWSSVGGFPEYDILSSELRDGSDVDFKILLMQLKRWVLTDEDFNPMEREIIINCWLTTDEEREKRKEMAKRLGVPRHNVDNTLKKFSKKYRKKVYALI